MIRTLLLATLLASAARAQPPEFLWYTFDSGDATNAATGTVGNGIAGAGVDFIGAGGLCAGTSVPAATSTVQDTSCEIVTFWDLALGTGDWTVGMHLDLTVGGGAPNFFQYCFGDPGSNFRCFVDGIFGDGNIGLRGPLADVLITGGGSQSAPVHVAWVYDSSGPVILGYLNGALATTVAQAPLNIMGTDFRVLRYAPSTSSLAPGVVMDDFRFYGRALSAAEIAAWAGCGAAASQYQFNQLQASLDHAGVQTNGSTPAVVSACPGQQVPVNLSGTPGLPYEIVLTFSAPVPRSHPGSTTLADGQVLNLDRFDPSLIFLWGGGGTPDFQPLVPFSLPLTAPSAPVTWTGQVVAIDFTQPSLLSLSQANHFIVDGAVSAQLALSDDTVLQVPICTPISFYGTSYSEIFVMSNGRVGFASGSGDFSPSVAEATSGPPSVGFWTDLSPNQGGWVDMTTGAAETTVSFHSVPYYTEPTSTVSFSIVLEASGIISITGLDGIEANPLSNMSFASGNAQLLGITNGNLGTGAATLMPLPFMVPVAGAPGDAILDFWDGTAGTAPGGVHLLQTIQVNTNGAGNHAITYTPLAGGYTALSH